MPSLKAHLNYTTLGLLEPEVFPYQIWDEDILVEKILEGICTRKGDTYPVSKSTFWLVCNDTTLD